MSKSCYEHLAVTLTLFSFIGLWNIREQKFKKHGPKIFITILFHVLAISFQISLLESTQLLYRAITLLKILVPCLCSMFMYVTMLLTYNNSLIIWAHLAKDWESLEGTEDRAILVQYAKKSKLYTMIIAYFGYGFYIIFIFWPLLRVILGHVGIMKTTVEVSFIIEYFLDIRNYSKYYIFILVFVNVTVLIVITESVAAYSAFIFITQHACAMFHIIGHMIKKTFKKRQSKFSVHDMDDEAYDLIIKSIIYYGRVVEFIRLINTCSEVNYLVQMALAVIITGVNFIWMFQLDLSITTNYEELLLSFILILGSLFIIYINCYIGQELSDHSLEYFQNVCNIPFYMGSLRTQKLVLWLMTRSIKPCTISIGKLFTSSHECFSRILQNAFTIAMLFFSLH